MKKSLLLTLLIFFLADANFAQETVLKLPPSFQYKNSLVQKSQIYKATLKQDVSQFRAEDMEQIKNGQPLRIAVGIASDLELNNETGQWLSLPTGERIWQQAIKSEGASGLILSFKELYIPEGAKLFVYTEDRAQSIVFSHETNSGGGAYATDILYQDEVVLEYLESTISQEQPRVNVSNIGYVYRTKSALVDDMTCYINVNCSEGADWQLQKSGVVALRISLRKGNRRDWYTCSGSLINNVRQDKTPYILTANHCVEGHDAETFSTMTVNFFTESTETDCTSVFYESSLTESLTGTTLIADIPYSRASDGTLLELTNAIPGKWEVYYNGWDARDMAATSGVSIHHPNGMVKKISTFSNPLISTGNIQIDNGIYSGANANWKVNWTATTNGQSVTYLGSSGAPIFNENGHIVGTLTGGNSYCQYPNEEDYFGKFSHHWDRYSDETQHFKNFLDPDETGILVLNGYDPNAFDFEEVPVAEDATAITKDGFMANWNALANATKYHLDVYRIERDLSLSYLDGYKSKNVGNVTSFFVAGLESATQYHYVVRAGAGVISMSESSNEIVAVTSSVESPSAFNVWIDNENINIRLNSTAELHVYDLAGQLLLSQVVSENEVTLSKTILSSGIYFIKFGAETHKILIK